MYSLPIRSFCSIWWLRLMPPSVHGPNSFVGSWSSSSTICSSTAPPFSSNRSDSIGSVDFAFFKKYQLNFSWFMKSASDSCVHKQTLPALCIVKMMSLNNQPTTLRLQPSQLMFKGERIRINIVNKTVLILWIEVVLCTSFPTEGPTSLDSEFSRESCNCNDCSFKSSSLFSNSTIFLQFSVSVALAPASAEMEQFILSK